MYYHASFGVSDMSEHKSVVIWVDNLRPISVVCLGHLNLRNDCREIRYFRSTRLGRILARCLRLIGILRSPISPVEFSLGHMRSPDGSSLRYGIEEDVLRITGDIVEHIYANDPLAKLLEKRLHSDNIRLYLQKALVDDIYVPIMMAHIAGWYRQTGDEMQRSVQTLLIEDLWFPYLRPYMAAEGLRLYGYSALPSKSGLLYLFLKLLRFFVYLVRIIGDILVRALRGESLRNTPSFPMIAVQYCGGADLEKRPDYFWFPGSGLAPKHVLVYFDRSDRPATEEVVNLIESLGMNWVIARQYATRIPKSIPWKATPFYVKRSFCTLGMALVLLVSVLRVARRPEYCWEWTHLVNMLRTTDFWEAFFQSHNVKVHIHTITSNRSIIAQLMAIERAGGINVGYHWSHLFFEAANQVRAHDVYFSWGPHYRPYLDKDVAGIDYLVYCGHVSRHVSGYRDDMAKREAVQIRRTLILNGAKYVICLFDSSFNEQCHYSKTMAVQLYTAFLNELLVDERVGLVIKPKNADNLELLPEITELLEEAIGTGRCVVLDHERGPSEAAQAADIAVGLGINSAVIEAVLAGVPGLHCDLTRKRDHPFYEWGYERIVFDNLQRLMEVLRQHRCAPAAWPFLGDHSPVMWEIDPFQDGKAAQRMGMYINWFMEAIIKGASREEALKRANANYASSFGIDKVVRIGQNA